jgi:spermidine synthase
MDRIDAEHRRADHALRSETPGVDAPSSSDLSPATDREGRKRLPIEVVDVASIPGGGQLHLLKCGQEFSIQFGEDELMGSRDHISEMALATMTAQRLPDNDGHVLVGGLGMGFTLGAVLRSWSPTTSIMVAELLPEVVSWAKGPLAHLFGDNLSDPRVTLRVLDVHDVIAEEANRFDAILLDVDNGPDGFITTTNDRLYSQAGLRALHAALRPGGILAVWSAYPDDYFSAYLENTGFDVDEVKMPAYVGSIDRWHTIWFAAKAGSRAG